jgi:uncharacterized protein (TIGR02302 family)
MKPWSRETGAPEGSLLPVRRVDRRYWMSAIGLILETLLPAALPALGVICAFVILGWLGTFSALEPHARLALTAFFGLALIVLAHPLLAVRLPAREAIERRLDRSRPDLHRPLATLADRFSSTGDPVAAALWQAHRRRAEAAAASLHTEASDPNLRSKDRFALRAGAIIALIAAAFVAGDERTSRLALAFDWTTPQVPPAPPRLDAWIDPPAYTGRPPLFLSGTNTVSPDEVIRAPVGSILSVRSTVAAREGNEAPTARLVVEHGPGLEAPPPGDDKTALTKQAGITLEKRVIRADSTVRIRLSGQAISTFQLVVIPDLPPVVRLEEARIDAASPDRQQPGGVRLVYTLEDDYGIAKADVVIERTHAPAGNGATGREAAPPLFPPPVATLPLRLGAGEMLIATEDHPWAGEEVRIRIRVEDDLGQSAESEAKTVILPQRPFSQPVARALMEQRRDLNFSPGNLSHVRLAFDALLFEPERFTPKVGDFMAIDLIRAALRHARDREKLKGIVEEIHELALFLENGDMTEAEKRLREAEARLREALERDAPPEEVKRLAEELRRAMDQFLREFAERSLRDQDQNGQNRPPMSPERMLTQRDLSEMLKKIEELARSGKTAEAQQLLNQLKQMLDNLRTARRQDVDPRMRELGQQIEELDKLQREQRDLRDRTFREGQQQRQQGQRGQQKGQQGQQGDKGLKDQQQALRDRLNQLRERLRQRGIQEGEGFGEAENGMEDAEGKLGQGQNGPATEGQQRALDGLGKAGQGMAQELQRQLGQGDENGEGEGDGLGQPGPGQRGRAASRFDPLGRPSNRNPRDFEDHTRLNEENEGDVRGTIGERAERVLRELRRRLGEFERPQGELDYLERLLRQR